MKKEKLFVYSFLTESGEEIKLMLNKSGFQFTAEIFINDALITFDTVDFCADYWLKFLDRDGQHYLIAVKEESFEELYEVKCYQNRKSLTDDETVDDLVKNIREPYYGKIEYWKKRRRKNLLIEVIASLLGSCIFAFVFFHSAPLWERFLNAIKYFVVYRGLRLLGVLNDRRGRNCLLKQISENDKNIEK